MERSGGSMDRRGVLVEQKRVTLKIKKKKKKKKKKFHS